MATAKVVIAIEECRGSQSLTYQASQQIHIEYCSLVVHTCRHTVNQVRYAEGMLE